MYIFNIWIYFLKSLYDFNVVTNLYLNYENEEQRVLKCVIPQYKYFYLLTELYNAMSYYERFVKVVVSNCFPYVCHSMFFCDIWMKSKS